MWVVGIKYSDRTVRNGHYGQCCVFRMCVVGIKYSDRTVHNGHVVSDVCFISGCWDLI